MLASRFDPRKNILELVSYFCEMEHHFDGWNLVVAGYCDPLDTEYYNKIKRIAEGHSVDLLANVTKAQLDQLYMSSSIFWHGMGINVVENLNPVDVEHFGITTVEAMSAGVVPVVIDKGGQQEIVDDGMNGFSWHNFDQLMSETQRLIRNPDLRLSMSRAAVEKSNMYSLEAYSTNMDNIFQDYNLIPRKY
jgi:glycosyltransferase involved in cell wall biosynthesis